MTATTDEIREALEHNAERDTKGRWHFAGSIGFSHAEDEALAITEDCLLLDMPVTDMLTSQSWRKVVSHVIDHDRRIAELERAANTDEEPGDHSTPAQRALIDG